MGTTGKWVLLSWAEPFTAKYELPASTDREILRYKSVQISDGLRTSHDIGVIFVQFL